jgi:hypothetical protein
MTDREIEREITKLAKEFIAKFHELNAQHTSEARWLRFEKPFTVDGRINHIELDWYRKDVNQ